MSTRRTFFKKLTTAVGIAAVAPHIPETSVLPSAPKGLKLWYRMTRASTILDPDGSLRADNALYYVHEDALQYHLENGFRIVGQPFAREDVHVS
jgi:hypothetical protein